MQRKIAFSETQTLITLYDICARKSAEYQRAKRHGPQAHTFVSPDQALVRGAEKEHSMATNKQQHDLSTYEGCQALFVEKGRKPLVREDFPATDEGWAQWCDHRVRKFTKEMENAAAEVEYYKRVRVGEHMVEAVKAAAEVVRLEQKLAAKKAELAKSTNSPVKS